MTTAEARQQSADLERLTDVSAASGFLDSTGLHILPPGRDYLLAKVTAVNYYTAGAGVTPPFSGPFGAGLMAAFSWVSAEPLSAGKLEVDLTGYAGSPTYWPAYEISGNESVPFGATVRLFPANGGQYFWFVHPRPEIRWVEVQVGAGETYLGSGVFPWDTTSTTSRTIASSGSMTFTVGAGKFYMAGDVLLISNDSTHYMTGVVTSYTGTTLVMAITGSVGTGTFASWTILALRVQGAYPGWLCDDEGPTQMEWCWISAMDNRPPVPGIFYMGKLRTPGGPYYNAGNNLNRKTYHILAGFLTAVECVGGSIVGVYD